MAPNGRSRYYESRNGKFALYAIGQIFHPWFIFIFFISFFMFFSYFHNEMNHRKKRFIFDHKFHKMNHRNEPELSEKDLQLTSVSSTRTTVARRSASSIARNGAHVVRRLIPVRQDGIRSIPNVLCILDCSQKIRVHRLCFPG